MRLSQRVAQVVVLAFAAAHLATASHAASAARHESDAAITVAPAALWSHSWDTAGASFWGDFGYSLLTDTQAAFVANHYFLADLEKCTGKGQGMTTEAAIYQTAAQLKKANPAVKVGFYWSCDPFVTCYAANVTYDSHPEWFLHDDYGNRVGSPGHWTMDWTNDDAVSWWVSVPLSLGGAAGLIDGVLADGAAYGNHPNISQSRSDVLFAHKLAMIGQLQDEFDKLGNGGVVFGNGLQPINWSATDPTSGFRILDAVKGVQNEHYAAFEQVNRSTGELQLDMAAQTLANIETAAAYRNGTRQVFASFWPGPFVGFSRGPGLASGWPVYHDDTQPCGTNDTVYGGPNCTQAQHMAGWRAMLTKYLPFNLASFLSVAASNTWFTYAVWYADNQGFYTCADDPDSCATPNNFYSDYLDKPLGVPLGPRKAVGAYKWTREFEHATVTVDLSDPVGGSGIAFHQTAADDDSAPSHQRVGGSGAVFPLQWSGTLLTRAPGGLNATEDVWMDVIANREYSEAPQPFRGRTATVKNWVVPTAEAGQLQQTLLVEPGTGDVSCTTGFVNGSIKSTSYPDLSNSTLVGRNASAHGSGLLDHFHGYGCFQLSGSGLCEKTTFEYYVDAKTQAPVTLTFGDGGISMSWSNFVRGPPNPEVFVVAIPSGVTCKQAGA